MKAFVHLMINDSLNIDKFLIAPRIIVVTISSALNNQRDALTSSTFLLEMSLSEFVHESLWALIALEFIRVHTVLYMQVDMFLSIELAVASFAYWISADTFAAREFIASFAFNCAFNDEAAVRTQDKRFTWS